ncbi:MAG: hypothetical protein GY851_04235 [bacterium]|nr:hypothetical protein [bacterium]
MFRCALHKAGLEVILDVVFNHTAEDRGHKPALGFRGIDHGAYYLLDEAGDPIDQTGCGNTVNCNHPVMRDLVVQSLRHWVTEYGIDGFRFDLAAILHRNRWGSLLEYSPLVERIDEDPVLRDTKLIAEPWDLAGGHLVGTFGGARWCEWNGRYRDDVRRFWRSDDGTKDEFALRITGSPDLYQERGRTPHNSINFVTAHDGFTLRDLVSYESKHNEANGEDNRDGENHNFSLNCGVEGPTDDPAINTIRLRMQKNHLATLLVSLGVPMLLGGDEFGRTQRGNNNAYCQDNAISWFDWSLLEKNWGLFRFCRGMLAFRMENGVFSRDEYFTGRPNNDADSEDLLWFNAAGAAQDWQPGDRTLACRIHPSENDGVALYLMFNPSEKSATFRLPKGHWRVRVDTSRTSPDDIIAAGEARRVPHRRKYLVEDRSLAILADWG